MSACRRRTRARRSRRRVGALEARQQLRRKLEVADRPTRSRVAQRVRYARANELFGTAITEDPSVFRRLGISLPARVHGGPTGLASEAADLLSQSPRFHERSSGFEVDVTGDGNELRACLRTPNGNEIRCATARPPEPREDAEAAERDSDDDEQEALSLPQRLAEEFHQQIFGTRLMLSSVDLTSLDGRTNGGSALANERLRELMNQPSP